MGSKLGLLKFGKVKVQIFLKVRPSTKLQYTVN